MPGFLKAYVYISGHVFIMTAKPQQTTEIAAMKEFSVPDTPQYKLLIILKEADMVKFAGQKVDEAKLHHTLDIVEKASQELENSNGHIQ